MEGIVVPPHKTKKPGHGSVLNGKKLGSSSAEDLADVEDKEVLDAEQGSILMGVIRQLSKGMDLHRVTLPTFVLEPRSMLERITDFFAHPDLLQLAVEARDPVSRFLGVVRYFLAGWHIKPKGVRKPYNPVLGEIFRCRWDLDDGTQGYYVAEQTSHHPPMSSFYYAQPANHIQIQGELSPRSKFLGNSAATIMQGGSTISFPGKWDGEEYEISMPNVYARGILFGTMYLELGDQVVIRCAKTDLVAEVEFTVKGFFSGTYNGLKGKVKRASSGEVLYTIGGKWSNQITLTPAAKKSSPIVWFDAATAHVHPKIVLPPAEQDEFESRRLWGKVTEAILAGRMDAATDEKSHIEDAQRNNLRTRQADGVEWVPRFFSREGGPYHAFHAVKHLDWRDTQQVQANLEKAIWSPPTGIHLRFWQAMQRRSMSISAA
ncbi:hypothetical protein DFJ74DRAFT_648862 [Hyaloraphidium curvatum]|nr:hypothetical protein DFJ74DRAFT_648862 [Hyaloraphidium curvatum]